MSQIVLRFLVNVFVIYVASRFFRGIQLAAPAAALWAGLALTLVNLLVRPVLSCSLCRLTFLLPAFSLL